MSETITYQSLLSELQGQIKKVNFREYPGLEKGKISDNAYSVIVVDEVIKTAKANNWTLYKKGRERAVIYACNDEYLLSIDIVNFINFMSQAAVYMGVPYCTAMYYTFKNRLRDQLFSVIEPINRKKGGENE